MTGILSILRGFGRSCLSENGEYTKKMIGALKYWLVNDFENPNWWHNQIGMPEAIGNIAIMMHPVLDKETFAEGQPFVSAATSKNRPTRSVFAFSQSRSLDLHLST